MEQWWKRIGEVDLGALTKEEIQDLTGCIPLFLGKCVVQLAQGQRIKLNTEFCADIESQARAREQEIQNRCSPSQLHEYVLLILPI